MWPNLLEIVDLVTFTMEMHLLKKLLMGNFIFCAVAVTLFWKSLLKSQSSLNICCTEFLLFGHSLKHFGWVQTIAIIRGLGAIRKVIQAYRSNHQGCSMKKLFLKTSHYSQKIAVLGSLFNKVAGLQACNIIKRRLYHRCFPMNIAKFWRTPILKKEHQRTAASGPNYKHSDLFTMVC